jgi:hypothetical protein
LFLFKKDLHLPPDFNLKNISKSTLIMLKSLENFLQPMFGKSPNGTAFAERERERERLTDAYVTRAREIIQIISRKLEGMCLAGVILPCESFRMLLAGVILPCESFRMLPAGVILPCESFRMLPAGVILPCKDLRMRRTNIS